MGYLLRRIAVSGIVSLLSSCTSNGTELPAGLPTQSTLRQQSMTTASTVGTPLKRLYVANYAASAVTEYEPGTWKLIRTITQAVSWPVALAVDSSGALYVANSLDDTITIYQPGSEQLPRVLGVPQGPGEIAFDHGGDLYVVEGSNELVEYNPKTGAILRTVSDGINSPVVLFIDASDNIYIANRQTDSVSEYAAGTDVPSRTITDGISNPTSIGVDSSGNLFISNGSANSVTVYAPGATTPSRTITQGITSEPLSLILDESGNLFVDGGPILEYAKGKSTPERTFAVGGPIQAYGLALDSFGRLYVPDWNAMFVFSKTGTLLASIPGNAEIYGIALTP